ncbi:MAG: hypothetical protein AAFQ89_00090 [Cyanobacteria bacterium J06626_18]
MSEAATYYRGANVEVSPHAVVAAGVVLQATADSQVVVEAGVCIGMGVVIQAYGGKLMLSTGANIGQGTLLLGAGTIGPQACIGAESTLINPTIAANQVIPARSLLGDNSRSLKPGAEAGAEGPSDNGKASSVSEAAPETAPDINADSNGNGGAIAPNSTVYGRDQVLKLVHTLFPHRNATMADPGED